MLFRRSEDGSHRPAMFGSGKHRPSQQHQDQHSLEQQEQHGQNKQQQHKEPQQQQLPQQQLVVLVTGANRGLGFQIAKTLASTGVWHVLVAARSPVKSAQAIKALVDDPESSISPTNLSPLTIDLTSDAAINMAVLYVTSTFGHLDLLINNAAISPARIRAPSLREQYLEMFNTNLFGTAVLTQAFVPLLRASRYDRRRIVNVSSELGSLTYSEDPNNSHSASDAAHHTYRASKAALNMLTVVDAAQLLKDGIEVVSVCPSHLKDHFSQDGTSSLQDPSDGAMAVIKAATALDVNGKLTSGESADGFLPW